VSTDLSVAVPEINRLHSEICDAARTSIEKAVRIGELLTEQKSLLKHGEWLPWQGANLLFSSRTATNYMRVFENRALLKSESVSDLNEAYALLEEPRKVLTDAQKVAADWEKITQDQKDNYIVGCCLLDEMDARRGWETLGHSSFGDFCWKQGIPKSHVDLAFNILDTLGLRGVWKDRSEVSS
jgi:Protein of unknown function (DUF3102)